MIILLFISCKNETGDKSIATSLTGVKWRLIELNGEEINYDSHNQDEIHIILDSTNNEIRGFAGCNNFNGSFTYKDKGRIKIKENLISTMMVCPNSNLEDKFFEVLKTIDNYSISGQALYLNKARMAPLAKFSCK